MKPLDVRVIANFFDEIEEKWLEPFDWCPNEKLPRDNRKTYRIKDLFRVRFRDRICRYTEDQEEDCRVDFHFIFRYNIMHVMQVTNELAKLESMADADVYNSTNRTDRNVDTTVDTTDTSGNTTNNTTKGLIKSGGLTGSVDAIQLGSLLADDLRSINTEKLPDVVDKNIRQYTQAVNVNNDLTTVTVEDTGNSTSKVKTVGNQVNIIKQGIEGFNLMRAHSVKLRRLHEEFVQCFNVLFY